MTPISLAVVRALDRALTLDLVWLHLLYQQIVVFVQILHLLFTTSQPIRISLLLFEITHMCNDSLRLLNSLCILKHHQVPGGLAVAKDKISLSEISVSFGEWCMNYECENLNRVQGEISN